MTNNKFIVFILTNGRPDNVITYKNLRKQGYTGPIRLIIDNLDKKKDQYIQIYKDEVIVFDKMRWARTTDSGDNSGDLRAAVYARNASFEIARDLGYQYFIQLEDDYTRFRYIYGHEDQKHTSDVKSLDRILGALIKFLADTPTTSIAMAQGGDLIGGTGNILYQKVMLKRKCMNSFCFDTNKPITFSGRMNDDVNAYTALGNIGKIFFSTYLVQLDQLPTQKVAGGMTEVYKDGGTYLKSFHTVMRCPSFVKVAIMSNRMHHKISWKHAVPKILSESVKKHG